MGMGEGREAPQPLKKQTPGRPLILKSPGPGAGRGGYWTRGAASQQGAKVGSPHSELPPTPPEPLGVGEAERNKAAPPAAGPGGGEASEPGGRDDLSPGRPPAPSPERSGADLPPGLRAPGAVSPARPAASRAPRAGKARTHQRVFICSLSRARSGRAGNKENTYLAALRGRPGGPTAGVGTPRSHSRPAGRPTPSLAMQPAEPTLPGARAASSPGAATFLRRQGPRLLPGRGSAGPPRAADRAGASDAGERRVPTPGCGTAAGSGPGPHLPTFRPRCGDGRTRSPRGKRGGGRGPGRSPRAGGVPGGGAGGLPAPGGHRPPGAPCPPPRRRSAPAPPRAQVFPQLTPRRSLPSPPPPTPPRSSPACAPARGAALSFPAPRAPPSAPPSPRPITARRHRSLCLGRGSGPMGLRGDAGGARLGQWAGRAGGEGRRLALGVRDPASPPPERAPPGRRGVCYAASPGNS